MAEPFEHRFQIGDLRWERLNTQIQEVFYLDDATIRGWHKTFQKASWAVLPQDRWQGEQPSLTSDKQRASSAWLDERLC